MYKIRFDLFICLLAAIFLTLEELRTHDGIFTMELDHTQFDSIRYESDFSYIHTDGDEYIAAKIGRAGLTGDMDNYRMPIGVVIHETPSLENLDAFVERYSEYGTVITDLYIDMEGVHGGATVKTLDAKGIAAWLGIALGLAGWFLIRFVTVRAGLFPPMWKRRGKTA